MKHCALLFCLLLHSLSASDVDSIYERYHEEVLTKQKIHEWLQQFDPEDREAAAELLHEIDYYSYPRLQRCLRDFHQKIMQQLVADGYAEPGELLFHRVDFTKVYPAKSGDLITYFYRHANKVRSVVFKNPEGLLHDGKEKSSKALVILEDYCGTGSQFLTKIASRLVPELLAKYEKIYFCPLVANSIAVERFAKLTSGQQEALAEEFAGMYAAAPDDKRATVRRCIESLPGSKIMLLCQVEEESLAPSTLLDKYCTLPYFDGRWSIRSRTAFFYNCPNNMPVLLWSPKNKAPDGSAWTPLFTRVEDISIYSGASAAYPPEEHVW